MYEVWEADQLYYQEEPWYHQSSNPSFSLLPSSSSSTTSSSSSSSSNSLKTSRFLHANRFERSPRFGYSNQFSDLFSSDEEVVMNYIIGLLVVSVLILTMFIIWFILLIVFKCCCSQQQHTIGFLSGSPFHYQQVLQSHHEEKDKSHNHHQQQHHEEDEEEEDTNFMDEDDNIIAPEKKATASSLMVVVKNNPWIFRGRLAFGLSCVCFLAFGIVLSTVGIGNLNTTTTTIGYGATQGYTYFYDAQLNLNNVIATVDLLVEVKNRVIDELQDFLKAMKLARDVHHHHEDGGSSGGNIGSSIQVLLTSLKALGTFLSDPLKEIDSTLNDGQQVCHDVYTTTEQIDLLNLQFGAGLVATIFPALLLGFLYRTINQDSNSKNNTPRIRGTQHQCLDCFLNCILWPCFVLLVIGCIVICCVISIVGLLNADFCSGGPSQTPDGTVLSILIEQGTDPLSFTFLGVDYVIHGCDARRLVTQVSPLHDVESLESQLNATLVELETAIVDVITTGSQMLTNETGYDATALAESLEEFRGPLTDLFLILGDFLQGMLCQPLYNLYNTIVHEATCTDSYTGTFWIFISLFMMSFFGLVAITFRAALYPPIATTMEPESEDDGWDVEDEEKERTLLVVGPNETSDSGLSSVTMTDYNTSTSEARILKDDVDEQPQSIYSVARSKGDSNTGEEEWSIDWTEKSNPSVKKYFVPEETFVDNKPSAQNSVNSSNLSSSWEKQPVATNNPYQNKVNQVNDESNGVTSSSSGNMKPSKKDGKNGSAVVSSTMMSKMRNSLRNLRPNQDNNDQRQQAEPQIQIHDSWNSWISEDSKHPSKYV